MKLLYRSLMATLILGFILCGAYPLLVYGVGSILFHDQIRGGILFSKEGKSIGANLIGQSFTSAKYFHSRPSSAGDKGYDAANSSGSNLGPTNQKFYDALKANIDTVLKENPSLHRGQVPGDLVTGSASGLDPHISPEAALAQVDRIAAARSLDPARLREVVQAHVEGPQWGLFGDPVVNVLRLNIDLDK